MERTYAELRKRVYVNEVCQYNDKKPILCALLFIVLVLHFSYSYSQKSNWAIDTTAFKLDEIDSLTYYAAQFDTSEHIHWNQSSAITGSPFKIRLKSGDSISFVSEAVDGINFDVYSNLGSSLDSNLMFVDECDIHCCQAFAINLNSGKIDTMLTVWSISPDYKYLISQECIRANTWFYVIMTSTKTHSKFICNDSRIRIDYNFNWQWVGRNQVLFVGYSYDDFNHLHFFRLTLEFD